MGTRLILVLMGFTLLACNPIDVPEGTPKCIKKEIRKRKGDECFSAVEKYTYNGETVYEFSYGKICSDATSDVLNEDCEKICTLGGLSGLGNGQCPDIDQATFIEVIWERD